MVLARADVFVDALAGAPLTADGPLLLTSRDRLDEMTAEEIDRVLADGGLVYLLGGIAAIDQTVAEQLEAVVGTEAVLPPLGAIGPRQPC